MMSKQDAEQLMAAAEKAHADLLALMRKYLARKNQSQDEKAELVGASLTYHFAAAELVRQALFSIANPNTPEKSN
ncbi:MAG: hypothetical protein EKK41_26815 [Hyphomicrobiales bacterium]|nr:MAG: hypothetical protein EKK41_26815 [Hyphomicrobiales bacterium]